VINTPVFYLYNFNAAKIVFYCISSIFAEKNEYLNDYEYENE